MKAGVYKTFDSTTNEVVLVNLNHVSACVTKYQGEQYGGRVSISILPQPLNQQEAEQIAVYAIPQNKVSLDNYRRSTLFVCDVLDKIDRDFDEQINTPES